MPNICPYCGCDESVWEEMLREKHFCFPKKIASVFSQVKVNGQPIMTTPELEQAIKGEG